MSQRSGRLGLAVVCPILGVLLSFASTMTIFLLIEEGKKSENRG